MSATNTDAYLCGIDADGKLAASFILYSGKEKEIAELTGKIHDIDESLTVVRLDSETYNQLIGNRGKEFRYKDGATVEYIPPEPTAEELADRQAQQEAYEAQTTFNAIQTRATRMMLAGGNVAAVQSEYQTALMSVSDAAALKMPDYFPTWDGDGHTYKVGDRVTYNDTLYKVLQAHTSQNDWTPDAAPSLFAKVLTSTTGEPLPWEQPGSTNPYMIGDRVTYNGKVYESTVDNNVWAPDAYPQGWKEVTE